MANTTCYNADGSITENTPCRFEEGLSTCCAAGWDCLSSGLCREHGTTAYSQGTCTNQNFQNCLSFCNQAQFDGYTEVSRCDPTGNSWCCAGPAGQGLGGVDCCTTNLTTSLEPYPFSTIDILVGGSSTSASTISASSKSTSSASSKSTSSASLQPTSSPSMQPTSQKHKSWLGTEIAVPMAIIIILLAGVAFLFFRKNRKQKQGLQRLQSEIDGDPLRQRSEMAADPRPHRPESRRYGEDPVWELDVTHYELSQPDAPRHEL